VHWNLKFQVSSSIIVLIAYKIFTKKAKKLVDKAMYPLYTKQVGCESNEMES
jgi:hypothetical protein